MPRPRLTRLELRLMDVLWTLGPASIREVLAALPVRGRPAYTTVQTVIYRLEAKGAVRRVKKISNAHIFEAAISRALAERPLVDDLLALFGGRTQPMMAHLIEAGRLTREDLEEAERLLDQRETKEPRK